MPSLSRLDKARSFAKRDVVARNGAKSGSITPANGEKRFAAGNVERRALEREETQRSSLPRKEHGSLVKQNAAEEEKERVLKSIEEDARKGLSVSACQRENFRRGRPDLKHTPVSSYNDTSTAAFGLGKDCDADRSGSKHRVLAQGEPIIKFTQKDGFKRITKLKSKQTSGIETSYASKDSSFSRIRVEEEKHLASSPSKSNRSSDELSSKSSSSAIAFKGKNPLLSSSELISADRLISETPLLFLRVTRRPRSERRRDDSCKSQSSKGVSLDGFGAELEEALLKKQEAEVDSGEQLVDSGEQLIAGLQKRIADAAAAAPLPNNANDAVVSADLRGTNKASLEEADEREEGELEPDDEVVEKRASEGGNNREDAEGLEMQEENRSQDCDGSDKQKCQKLHFEPSGHNVTSSEADGSKASVEIMKTHNVLESSDIVKEEERNVGANRLCEKKSDSGREGSVNLPAMDLNLNAEPTGISSQHAVSDGSTKRSDPSLPVELAPHESVGARGYLSYTHNICEDIKGDSHGKTEIGDKRDSTHLVEELAESSISGHKQKRQKVESLQLSLGLPGCPPGSSEFPSRPVENEVSRTHVVSHSQSLSHLRTETMSNGFTSSLSLSSFVHNPSCTLNCISHEDQELSCGGSMHLSQGRWVNQAGDDRGLCDANKSVTSLSNSRPECKPGSLTNHPVFQDRKLFGYGAGLRSDTVGAIGYGSNQAAQRNDQLASGHGNFARQESIQMGINQSASLVLKSHSERSKGLEGNSLSNVKVGLLEISSEPIAVMAQKLQELPDSFLEGLKGSVKEMLGSFAKREEFLAIQQIIRRRTDLTEETLLRAHPTQLEILVALKTGLQSFLEQGAKSLTYKALIEIFLQTRCRNIDCQQFLPVDGCECKVCWERKGFCHECMCMVCSKFDSDSNTSRWVGCDVCMHWCHTDCGIRMSHIKSTLVSRNGVELSEMQFQCLSCEHYMELYGFVKGVFENFASTWGAENLAKELDCVRRIFHGSEDARGKQLRWKAEEMLQMLERNEPVQRVCNSMLQFFSEDGMHLGKSSPVASKAMMSSEAAHNVEGASRAFATMGSVVARKLSNLVEEKECVREDMEGAEPVKREDGRAEGSQDLHSIIGAKLTDVLIYQARADAAREDAINLQHIISFKTKKMEEDVRIESAKLRLDAAEEQQRKRLDELQALERSHHEYEHMKLRIESDMKHLVRKIMEKSRTQLA